MFTKDLKPFFSWKQSAQAVSFAEFLVSSQANRHRRRRYAQQWPDSFHFSDKRCEGLKRQKSWLKLKNSTTKDLSVFGSLSENVSLFVYRAAIARSFYR